MKKIARYTYDVTTNTLTMSTAFEKKASTYGTAEYHILMELRCDHAGLKIEVEAPKKTSRGGLSFEQMEIYINYHRDADNRLSIFERVKALSKSQANPYAYVKKWFLQNYPKYTETPELDAEGYLKVKTEQTDAASTNETVSNEVAFPAAS